MFRITIYLLAFIMIGTSIASGKAYKFEYEKIIDAPQRPQLIVNGQHGDITIHGTPENTITIHAIKHVRAVDQNEAEKVAEHIEIKAEKKGRQILIGTEYHDLNDGSQSIWDRLFKSGDDSFGAVDFTLFVPIECAVDIENPTDNSIVTDIESGVRILSNSGNVTLNNIKGYTSINSATGDISLELIEGNIDIVTASSDITMTKIKGALDIQSTSGKKYGEYIEGPLKILQTSGNIKINEINGNIRIKSTSGDIEIEQEYGSINIETGSGDVKVKTELLSKDAYFIETSSGKVKLGVPEFSAGSVVMETRTGNINSRIPLDLRTQSEKKIIGDFGFSGPKITVLTTSGDIDLEEY